jgi:glycosyltransferase involved in cell wall biosynthesis
MSRRLRIVIVNAVYSEGMGYSENCLPKALATLGHEVHVVTSTYNVYGNEAIYDATYTGFLGPRQAPAGTKMVDGYTVHRLRATLVGGYVWTPGIMGTIRELRPDIVHCIEIGSLQAFAVAALRVVSDFKLFSETQQTMSVVKPYMRFPGGNPIKKLVYRLTRTLPGFLSSLVIEKVYAVTPDCGEVGQRFYGVPAAKMKYVSLGTDTDRFFPAESARDLAEREALRQRLGLGAGEIVCIYTGRFTTDKNPLVLARAVAALRDQGKPFRSLFVGEGMQKEDILATNAAVVPFMTNESLAAYYRAADIAVWPTQESMSMLDAAASGLPVVVSDQTGEPDRVRGNGLLYRENDVEDLAKTLLTLEDPARRQALGAAGRRRMVNSFSWLRYARSVEQDFIAALGSVMGVATSLPMG